jgi:hypothetical protein
MLTYAMPPGATLAPQAQLAGERVVEVLSYLNVTDKSSVPCYTQSRLFRWNIPRTFGGYKGRHCFYATDQVLGLLALLLVYFPY